MENFQLYKTNLLLGGQMKWDIIIDSDDNDLYIKDFNLTPISNNIAYTYQDGENLLNNKHRENIKNFYKKIKGNFYNEGLDEIFNTNWPTIVKKGETIQNYSNIYDMGCKRAKNYRKYNKQFEFLCPLWIEKLENSLLFKITVKDINSNTILANKSLDITSYINNYTHKKHNSFIDYFKEHIKYVELDSGNDKVASIKFNEQSYISGINAEYGVKTTKDISTIVKNMTTRERPLMEIDNMIITCFSNNNIICNQLFNFNICFNIDDLMSSSTAFLIKGNPLNISIDVEIDGVEIEKRDFYCNYDFISKDKFYDFTDNLKDTEKQQYIKNFSNMFDDINVLDYLHDNEYIDFINKNKYCQKICHWSLTDNTDYMFNLYKGFEGYGIILDEQTKKPILVENKNQYGKTPNIYIKPYTAAINNIGWINYEEMSTWDQFYKYIVNIDKYKKINPLYLNGQKFVNNLKYNYVPKNMYVLVAHVKNSLLSTIQNTYMNELSKISDNLYVITKDDLLLLITANFDTVTFAKLYETLYNANKNKWENINTMYTPLLQKLFNMMSTVQTPKIVLFNSGLKWEYTKGPNNAIKEISYIKDTDIDYVFRYDGNIKPYFIKDTDILYYKDYISDDRNDGKSNLQKSKYLKYMYSNYEPNYPSIDYCSYKILKNYDRVNLPEVPTSEHESVKILPAYEYAWFNNGISLFLLPEITFKHLNKKNEDNTYKNLIEIVREFLQSYYNVEDEELLNFIINLYEYESDWNYTSLINIDDYLYTIKLTLK